VPRRANNDKTLTQQLARLSGKSAPHGRSRHSTVPLGWKPRYDIRTGLADYIDAMRGGRK